MMFSQLFRANARPSGSLFLPLFFLHCISCAVAVLEQTSYGLSVVRGPCPGAVDTLTTCSKEDIDADLYLGGLFPVHKFNAAIGGCPFEPTLGAQYLQLPEAMRYAIEVVNNDSELLPDIKLGYEMRDTCLYPPHTLLQCLEFIGRSTDDHRRDDGYSSCTAEESLPNVRTRAEVVGVVGAALSGLSIKAAELLGLFKIPMISYASTSPRLSNKLDFPYFFRTVPSHTLTGRAIASVIRKLEWSFIGFVHTVDPYGIDGVKSVKTALGLSGAGCSTTSKSTSVTDLCLSKTWPITFGLDENDSIIGEIWKDILYSEPVNRSTIIVVIAQTQESRYFFQYLKQYGSKAMYADALKRNLTFMGSDGWGDVLSAVTASIDIAKGSLSPVPTGPYDDGFADHWKKLNPADSPGNPWLEQLWAQQFKCDPTGSTSFDDDCLSKNSLAKGFAMVSKVPHVYHAVLAFATALDNIYKQQCNYSKPCLIRTGSRHLSSALRAVNFTTLRGSHFEFDPNGDPAQARYDLLNVQFRPESQHVSFRPVGTYEADILENNGTYCESMVTSSSDGTTACVREALRLNETAVVWNSGEATRPVSACSERCPPTGYRRLPGGETDCRSCCWTCMPCAANTFSGSAESAACSPCAADQSSGAASSACVAVRVEQFSTASGLPIVVLCFAAVGMAGAISAIVHSARKARTGSFFVFGVEPTLFALSGVLLAYVSAALQSAGPSGGICFARTLLSTVGLTAVNSTLLVHVFFRVACVRDMGVAKLLSASRHRLVGSLAAVSIAGAVFIISCHTGGQCSGVRETVFAHVKLERRCGFRAVDITCLVFLCLVNAALVVLCVHVLRSARRTVVTGTEYDLRIRLFKLTSVAAGLSTLLAVVFLVVQGQDWSPQGEDSLLNAVTLQFATAFFLAVLLPPIRKLGKVANVDAAAQGWLQESSQRVPPPSTVIHSAAEAVKSEGAMQPGGGPTGDDDESHINGQMLNVSMVLTGMVTCFGSEFAFGSEGNSRNGSDDEEEHQMRMDEQVVATSQENLLVATARPVGTPPPTPAPPPPPAGDAFGHTVFRLTRLPSGPGQDTDVPALPSAATGLYCGGHGADCGAGDSSDECMVPEGDSSH